MLTGAAGKTGIAAAEAGAVIGDGVTGAGARSAAAELAVRPAVPGITSAEAGAGA